jgi:glyoxylase-like metal-dependent hydrolase (beta-lactamase superfamily II)/rhodanese-related sulfurtransferase
MIFEQLNAGSCRSYVLGNSGAPEVIIVDPRLEFVPQYLHFLEKNKYRLTHVIDTHTHADHVSGAARLQRETGCSYLMHPSAPVTAVSERIIDGSKIDVGGLIVETLSTPGHSNDSISLVFSGHVLTGDALFLDDGGAGRDDLYSGDPGEHFETLQRLGSLSEQLVVYPAHEYRGRMPSTIAEQKKRNPYLRYETKKSFIDFVKTRQYGPAEWMGKIVEANIKAVTDPAEIPNQGGGAVCEASNLCEAQNACEAVVGDSNYPVVNMITPLELKEKNTAAAEYLLLDVREPAELEGEFGSLDGVTTIPVGSLLERLPELENNKEKNIITVCKTGGRARTAANLLATNGFKKVSILQGGMKGYREMEKEMGI